MNTKLEKILLENKFTVKYIGGINNYKEYTSPDRNIVIPHTDQSNDLAIRVFSTDNIDVTIFKSIEELVNNYFTTKYFRSFKLKEFYEKSRRYE